MAPEISRKPDRFEYVVTGLAAATVIYSIRILSGLTILH
jgi:hypothetical protein